MPDKIPYLKLYNGVEMPVIGQGTYPMTGKVLHDAILGALDNGCRLLDTAHSYPNEASIGEALSRIFKKTAYTRQEVFITSKIGDKLDHGMPMGYYFYNSDSCPNKNHREVVRKQVEDSLRKLRTDYIDLLLIHWPYFDCLEEIWLTMEDLYREGIVRAIGVSNCKVRHLQRIEKAAAIRPMVNQIYFSPLNTQSETYAYCRNNQIVLEAYSPVMFLRAGNRFAASDEIRTLCAKYGKTVVQIVLRWNIDKQVVAIPKASSADHIRANYDLFDFRLTPDEIAVIDRFNENWQALPESKYCPGY